MESALTETSAHSHLRSMTNQMNILVHTQQGEQSQSKTVRKCETVRKRCKTVRDAARQLGGAEGMRDS